MAMLVGCGAGGGSLTDAGPARAATVVGKPQRLADGGERPAAGERSLPDVSTDAQDQRDLDAGLRGGVQCLVDRAAEVAVLLQVGNPAEDTVVDAPAFTVELRAAGRDQQFSFPAIACCVRGPCV